MTVLAFCPPPFCWQWLQNDGAKFVEALRRGMSAACILLHMATTPSIDQRIVHEDALNATVSLFRLHLTKSIIPSWNQTGPTTAKTAAAVAAEGTPKKRRRSSSSTVSANATTTSKEWKQMYKLVLSTVPQFLVLMERLQALLNSEWVSLDDQPLLMLTNASTAALEMDCTVATSYSSPTNTTPLGVPAAWGPQLQVASIDLLTAAFARYRKHRETILEDIDGILLKLPSGKRSLRAFEVRYASVSVPQALMRRNAQWLGPLLAKTCPLDTIQPHRIQMVSALLLQLLQASVVRPVYETVEDEDGNQEVRLRSGVGQCQNVADYLAAALLQRCSRKEASGAASEFRPILSNLVDDLLVVLLIPEYAAAEVMLLAIVRRIHRDMQVRTVETTYLNLAFDVLGKINAVQARLLAFHRDRPLEMKLSPSSAYEKDERVYECFCNNSHGENLIVQCDRCNSCWHGSCVSINKYLLRNEWICDPCRLGTVAMQERRKFGHNQDVPTLLDNNYAMRHIFMATLSNRSDVPGLEAAISFHLARWADELESKYGAKAKAATRVVVHGILDYWENGISALKTDNELSEEGAIRVILALLAKSSPLLLFFRMEVKFLIDQLSDDASSAFRRLSIKAIERTVEGDHQLMLAPIITNAVSRRLTDDSISVREAAVSLVGSYVVQFPAVTKAYHSSLLKCLSDVGVSVRKRAIKIFLEILTANPQYKARAEVFDILLQRAADKREEDSVRDLVHGLLAKLWMERGEEVIGQRKVSPMTSPCASTTRPEIQSFPSENQGDPIDIETSREVTPIPAAQTRPVTTVVQRRADIAAEQMIEVVRAGETSANLEIVLKRLLASSAPEALSGPRGNEQKKTQRVDKKQCDQLVKALFELLLSIEDQRGNRGDLVGKDIAATLRTIGVFADVSPSSVYRHLETVIPYLKADNGASIEDEGHIVGAACDIVARTSTVFGTEDIERLAESSVAKDLANIAYRMQPGAVQAAVRTLSCIAHHRHAPENGAFAKEVLTMARKFYRWLVKQKTVEDFSKAKTKDRSNTERALSVLGFLCQYHTRLVPENGLVESDDESKSTYLPDGYQLTWTNMNRTCCRLFTLYFDKKDSGTKCASLRALGGVFMVEPRLMLELEQKGFIKTVLDPDATVGLQLAAMASWRSILIAEEKRIDGGYARKKMEQDQNLSVSKKISGDQDGDSNIFGGILTSYADSIFDTTKAINGDVRYAAVELLEVIMRQGLVNPNEAVPHLFALQGDVDNPAIRTLSCSLLMAEGEKRPDTLRLRIRDGVKQAFDFQSKLRGGGEASALLPPSNSHQKSRESIFDGVFRECVSKNKKQRQGLFKNLLNLFDAKELQMKSSPKKKTNKKTSGCDVALLGFTAEILAYLPYTTATDPLLIIHHIRSIVSLQGEQVIDALANVLRPVGLASEDKYDDRNAGEDALERAAKSKFPSKTPESEPLADEKFDMTNFTRLCKAAFAMTMLLRLKRYLRTLYNLSEARCLEFDPNEKEKAVVDKGISKTEVKTLFDATVVDTSDPDSLIRLYAEFRHLMREESTIDSANGADSELDEDEQVVMASAFQPAQGPAEPNGRKRTRSSPLV